MIFYVIFNRRLETFIQNSNKKGFENPSLKERSDSLNINLIFWLQTHMWESSYYDCIFKVFLQVKESIFNISLICLFSSNAKIKGLRGLYLMQ